VRPQLKPTNPAYRVGDTILLQQTGTMLEIEDDDGDVAELLALLDGTRPPAEVELEFRRRRPGSAFDVAAGLAQLDEAGLLADADATAGSTLSDYERERWKRNLGFFETYANLATSKYSMQERLRDCKVALLGMGGVGSHISLDLLGLGVRDLRIVDFDKIELSNLNRQVLYTEADIGQRKLPAALKRLQAYYPAADIDGQELRLGSVRDVETVVADRDFVICCVDRPKVHVNLWVNEACVRARVPYTGGGVQMQRSILYLIIPGVTGCVECWRRSAADGEGEQALRRQLEERHAAEPGIGPDMAAFGPMVTTLTAMIVTEFVRFVTGIAPPMAAGQLIEMNFADLAPTVSERWERRADCAVCGEVTPSS
jgi:molybdopterin/thiamine biosynthesis adenylyltransferase